MKELKKLGSETGQRLKHWEEKFEIDRKYFGNEHYNEMKHKYIRVPLIARKLFGSEDVPFGSFALDSILQAANLATLMRHLLVLQREMMVTDEYLQDLAYTFPQSFVSQFKGHAKHGSALSWESFEQALEIRTQFIITDLFHTKNSNGWNPDSLLANFFFGDQNTTTSEDAFTKLYKTGRVFMQNGITISKAQEKTIRTRVMQIRQAFRHDARAIKDGDLVDFDYLEEEFPWNSFVAGLAQWARLRADEIESSIAAQGGFDAIMKGLNRTVKASDSLFVTPSPILLPSAEIKPAVIGQKYVMKVCCRRFLSILTSYSVS